MAGTCLPSFDGAHRGKITRTFGEVTFSSEFDSGNLDRVELVENEDGTPLTFTLWTAPDCAGTTFENGNSSWFYFKVVTQANFEGNTLRLTIMNLNKQLRLYQQGFSPIFKTFPGRNRWERLRGPLNVEVSGEKGLRMYNTLCTYATDKLHKLHKGIRTCTYKGGLRYTHSSPASPSCD